jgi:hypothetical protein
MIKFHAPFFRFAISCINIIFNFYYAFFVAIALTAATSRSTSPSVV